MSKVSIICTILVVALASASYGAADVVIGNWENMPTSGDGWVDWGQGQVLIETLPAKYVTEPTIGVTLDDDSLHVIQAGWGQSLAIKLQNLGLTDEFMARDTFSIDMTVAAASSYDPVIEGGYSQISTVSMNAAGPGWTDVATGNPLNFYWWSSAGQRTGTLSVDYSAFRDLITSTGYIEIILTLNTGGGAPPDMYFDNARLSGVPEPATIALLGLGGLALRRRKR